MKYKSTLFISALLITLLSGCSKNAEALVGRYKADKEQIIVQVDPADKDGVYQVKLISYYSKIMGVDLGYHEKIDQVLQTVAVEKNRVCTKDLQNTRCFELSNNTLITKNPHTGEAVTLVRLN